MRRRLLLILPALQQLHNYEFRLIKYSRFPPLSLLTIAGLTPEDRWEIIVRDEHIESSEVDGDVDLVGIQTYISSSGRAYELARRWRERGAKVVLGGLHPTSLPDEAAPHADAVVLGPAESVWKEVLDDFERGTLKPVYQGRRDGSAALVPVPRRDLMNPRGYLIRNTMVTSRGCPHSCDFCYKTSFWGKSYYEARPLAQIEHELDTMDDRLVFFLDDNLLANRRHARSLFPILRDRGIVWQAAASLDVARGTRLPRRSVRRRLPFPLRRIRVAFAGEHARQQQGRERGDRLRPSVPPVPRRRDHDQREFRLRIRLRRAGRL